MPSVARVLSQELEQARRERAKKVADIHSGNVPMQFHITEGEHAGHEVTRDMWAIDFEGANPDTSFYCLTCHERLTGTIVPEED